MKIKNNLPKLLSAAMSLVIICAGIGTAAFSAGAESAAANKTEVSSASGKSSEKKSENSSKGSSKSEKKAQYNKKETVYVIADAQGNPDKVIVSNWIKNTGSEKTIKDKTNLKDIEVLKGGNSYTIDENHVCEWDAEGGDIYYKGTGTSKLPVGVSITYQLDGKAVSPSDLAGKSGRLKMKIVYTNREYSEETVNGKKEKIYVPFVMLTGMMLDNEKADNVTVSNGNVFNDGTHNFVVGFALPGMQETIKLDSKELSIPSTVEITADVKDFELATTMTVASNDMFGDMDVSKLDSKSEELNNKLGELVSATDSLLDGTSQLYSGMSTLLDKSGELIDGVEQLYDGSWQIKEGAEGLKEGAVQLNDGAAQLDGGLGELKDGADRLDDGLSSLSDGAEQLDSGANDLADGAVKLDSGVKDLQGYLSDLSSGLDTLSSNSAKLNSGAKQVFDALLSTADNQIAASGLSASKLTIENYGGVLDGLIASLSDENARALAEQTALKTVTATVESQRDLIRQGVENAVRKQVTEGVLSAAGMSMSADDYDAAVASGQIPEEIQAQVSSAVSAQMNAMQGTIDDNTETQIQSIIEENMNSDQVQTQINDGVQKAAAGRTALQNLKQQLDSYNTFYNGIVSYTAGVDEANSGAKQILDGTAALKTGTGELVTGTDQLKVGTGKLNSGASQLKSGSSSLKDGAGQLKEGSEKLASGTNELSSGAGMLSSGSGELFYGIDQMRSGAPALIDGITQLKDGSMQLNDGMKKYKEEGVDKLKKAADGDLKTLVERIKAISKVSKSYKSYSGIAEGADGQVDFIFKTAGIENNE